MIQVDICKLWSDCHGLSVLASSGKLAFHLSCGGDFSFSGRMERGRVARVVTWWDGGRRAHCPAGEMTLMNGEEMEFYMALFEFAFKTVLGWLVWFCNPSLNSTRAVFVILRVPVSI